MCNVSNHTVSVEKDEQFCYRASKTMLNFNWKNRILLDQVDIPYAIEPNFIDDWSK